MPETKKTTTKPKKSTANPKKTDAKPKQTSAKTEKKPTNTKTEVASDATPKKKAEKKLIDVRIIAVPEREKWAKANQKILGIDDKSVVWDKEHEGVIPTAKKAWTMKTDSPYVMVMNDDAELCNDFMKYCEMIVNAQPDSIISLFPYQFRHRKMVRQKGRKSPYVTTRAAMGLAIIMKTEYIKPCIDSWSDDFGDDVNITRWAKAEGIPIITTLPSIIQHIGDDSVLCPGREVGRTDFFVKYPSESNIDWTDTYVTGWSNVVSR